jgi:hypothetical protein
MWRNSGQNLKNIKNIYFEISTVVWEPFLKKIEVMFKKDDEDKLLINSYDKKRKERIFLQKKTFLSG